jgi:4-amino-4-deoxy-L-arabinose transferase-like glycosyltransferase
MSPVSHRAAGSAIGWWVLLLALVPGLWLWRLMASDWSGAGLYVDEAQYWDWSRQLAWGYFSKPPGVALLIGLSSALGGTGLMGVRWLIVLMWTLTPLVLWRLVWEISRDTGRQAGAPARDGLAAGAWAAVLTSACLVSGLVGQVATTDGPLLFGWALLMWLFWRAQQRPDNLWRWGLWGTVLTFTVLSKYTAVVVVGSALWLAWSSQDRRVWRGLVLAGFWSALLMVPHLLWNHAHGWPTLRHTAELLAGEGDPGAHHWLPSLLTYLASQCVVLGPVVLVVAASWAWRRWRSATVLLAPERRVLWWAWAWSWPMWLIGGVQAMQGKGQLNWAAPAVLGFVLLMALLRQRLVLPLRPARLGAVLVLGALVSATVSLGGDWRTLLDRQGSGSRWDIWSRARGWDAAFEAMAPQIAQRPGMPLVTAERAVVAHATYAWRAQGWRPLSWRAGPVPMHHYEMLYPWAPQAGQPVLFITAENGVNTIPDGLKALLPRQKMLFNNPDPARPMALWLLEPGP